MESKKEDKVHKHKSGKDKGTSDKKDDKAKKVKKGEPEEGLSAKMENMSINTSYIPVKKLASLSQAGKDDEGKRKTNQDSFLVMEKLKGSNYFNLFAVMDGHGPSGHLVSQFITKYVTGKINSNKRLEAAKGEEELYAALKKNNYEIIWIHYKLND